MQLFTSLGRPWDLSTRPMFKIFFGRFPVEFISLFSFILIAQQFINESSLAVLIHIFWTIAIYLLYIIRSQCYSDQFNQELNLDIDEIVNLFHQLPNCNLFQDILFSNYQSSTEWINCFLNMFWPKFSAYFNKKFKVFNLTLIKFFTLGDFSIGQNCPLIESLSSSLISHNHEDTMMLNFNLYWLAEAGIAKSNDSQTLVSLKFFHYSIGSLVSFCFKANCQLQFKFMQWQMNEEIQLKDIQFSFTHSPKLHYLNATGLIWLLDNLQLVRPIVYIYLKQRFLFPNRAVFKFQTPFRNLARRPTIGCPIALFSIDVIQAENLPLIKNRKAQPADGDKRSKEKAKNKSSDKIGLNDELNITTNLSTTKRCKLFRCFNYQAPSVFCKVKIFNQQFVSPQINSSTNPLWNFRCFTPIFSHNKHSIEQLEKYHGLFQKDSKQENPIDLNASFYQFPFAENSKVNSGPSSPTSAVATNIKKFISYEFLENLSIIIQVLDKQENQNKLIAEFQISDPSQYFLDPELNGQSIWINSSSSGVLAMNVDQSTKLNVRFTFLTLNHRLSSVILSNAHLANRLAFPIGVILVFIDSAIVLNIESLKSNLNPKSEYGFQIVCQLGNQILYTSICTDLSFIWENELLFSVYSLNLERITVKLVARNLSSSNYDVTTIATNYLDLSGLINQPTLALQQYCPLVLKNNSAVQLKLLLTFRIVHFTSKLMSNCLRNAKVAEEDLLLIKEKQYYIEEKLKSSKNTRQVSVLEDSPFENTFIAKKSKIIVDEELNHMDNVELNEEIDQSVNSVEPVNETETRTMEIINMLIFVRMRWPKVNKFIIEIVDLKCAKFLALFQIYSIDVYLNCVLREKEKAIQSKKTKNFKLKSTTVSVNQKLTFNCISKPLSEYHLNISLHEKRTEEYSKVAEIYTPLPALIQGSGQIDKQLILNITPMYLKTSGFNAAFSPDNMDQFEIANAKNESIQ